MTKTFQKTVCPYSHIHPPFFFISNIGFKSYPSQTNRFLHRLFTPHHKFAAPFHNNNDASRKKIASFFHFAVKKMVGSDGSSSKGIE